MIACFFAARFPPPKREIGGIRLSMSVPVVLTTPSRKAWSIHTPAYHQGYSKDGIRVTFKDGTEIET